MKALFALLGTLAAVAYFGIGFVQLFAIAAGIKVWLGVGSALAMIGALFVTYIPFAGTVLGVMGAAKGWDWSYLSAGLLFGFPYFLFIVAGIGTSMFKDSE